MRMSRWRPSSVIDSPALGWSSLAIAVATTWCVRCLLDRATRQVLAEAARLDRAMHPAFLRRACFPPPPARASVLALADHARAWRASDRLVALVIERVVRHVIGADVIPDLGFGPVGQRRELDDAAVVVIDFNFADVRARRPLIAAQSRDPRAVIHERAAQRQHLAHLAA